MTDPKKSYDFGAELDDLEPAADWTPNAKANDTEPKPDMKKVREIAEEQGFTSREPKPQPEKEPSDQVSIRGKASVIKRFKDFCKSQEPEWPQGFALEKLLDAYEAQQRGQGG